MENDKHKQYHPYEILGMLWKYHYQYFYLTRIQIFCKKNIFLNLTYIIFVWFQKIREYFTGFSYISNTIVILRRFFISKLIIFLSHWFISNVTWAVIISFISRETTTTAIKMSYQRWLIENKNLLRSIKKWFDFMHL